jgi:hypothetical protein
MTFRTISDPRTERIYLRVTEGEKAQLEAMAAVALISISDFIRRAALGHPIRARTDQIAINELRRLGGLIKHTHNLSGDAFTREHAALLAEITLAIKVLSLGDREQN